jgi:hypothetical protein
MSSVNESPNASKKTISGVQLAADIRAGMDESHVLTKYNLSHDQLLRAIGKLVSGGLLSENELQTTSERDPDLTIEVNPKICPACRHEQPSESTECAKCGLVFNKVRTDTRPFSQPPPDWTPPSYKKAGIVGLGLGLVLLIVALGWYAVAARKEARIASDEALKQEESRKATEEILEELQHREQGLLDREYDLKQVEYEKRVNSAVSALSMAGQRWTEDFDRKLSAYERIAKQQEARGQQLQSRQLRDQRIRASAHFRAYGAIVKDIQNLGVDYRTRSLTRGRAKQVAKSFQTKLFALKTYPSANPSVLRSLETAVQHLMVACRATRYSEARSNLEDFWKEANAATELMSHEIAAARP